SIRPAKLTKHGSKTQLSTIMYVAATKRLTHEGAKHMAAVALERAQTAGIAIAVAVADAGGHLLVLERIDGGPVHTVHSAPTQAPRRRSARPPTSVRPLRGAHRRRRSMSSTRLALRSLLARSGGPPWRAASR